MDLIHQTDLIYLSDVLNPIYILLCVQCLACNKADITHTFIIDSKSSIVAITETWPTNNDSSIPSHLTPTNFDIIQANRLSPPRGGGLTLLYSSEVELPSSSLTSPPSLAEYSVIVSRYH